MANPELDGFRQKYPAYKDVPDGVLAGKIYDQFYAGKVDKGKYYQHLGIPMPDATATPQPAAPVVPPAAQPTAPVATPGTPGFKGAGQGQPDPNFGLKPFDPQHPDPAHPNITLQDITGSANTAAAGFWSMADRALGRLPDVSPAGTDFLDRMKMMDPTMDDAGRQKYLQNRYGKDNVFTDPGGELYVKLPNGAKVYPSGGGAWKQVAANIASTLPEQMGWQAGAEYGGALGAEAGPWTALGGAILGGVGGTLLGKKAKEAEQMVAGEYTRTPQQELKSDLQTMAAAAATPLIGRGISSPFVGLATRGMPRWWASQTPELQRLTKMAIASGGVPPIKAALPGMTVTAWHQAFVQKIGGDLAEARNVAAVQHDVHNVLLATGMTPEEAAAATKVVFEPAVAVPTKVVGGEIQKAVEGHQKALASEAEAAANTVDSHLKAAMAQLRLKAKAIKGSVREGGALVAGTAGKLWEDTAQAIRDSRKEWGRMMQRGYAQIDRLVGDKPIIPTFAPARYAKNIVERLKPESDIRRIVEEIAKWGPMETFENMQRMRTRLHELGEPSDLAAAGITKREFRQLAKLVDVSFSRAELGNAPQAVRVLRKMDSLYATGIKQYQDETINTIVDAAKTGIYPDATKLVSIVFQPGQAGRAAAVMKILPPELQDRVRAEYFNTILESTKDAAGQVKAATLLTKFSKPAERTLLEAAFGKKTADEFSNYVKALAISAPNSKVPVGVLNAGRLRETIEAAKAAQDSLDSFIKQNFMAELIKPTMNPENVYSYLINRANESDLEKAVTFLQAHNPQALVKLRQLAMTDLAHRAVERIGTGAGQTIGPDALQRALSDMTERQQELLFPNGAADALHNVADMASHLFPKKGPNMSAALAAGTLLSALPFGYFAGGAGGLRTGAELAITGYVWSIFWNHVLSNPKTVLMLSQGLGTPGPARTIAANGIRMLVRAAALGMLPDDGNMAQQRLDPAEAGQ